MVDEEETNKETEQEKPETPEDAGDKPKASNLINDANLAAERLEKANEKKEGLLKQEQELEARRALGGRTSGAEQAKPKEETDKEYSDRIDQDIREGKYNG